MASRRGTWSAFLMFHDSGPLARNSLRFAVLGESGAGWLVAFSWLGRKEVFVRAMLENGNVLWDKNTSFRKTRNGPVVYIPSLSARMTSFCSTTSYDGRNQPTAQPSANNSRILGLSSHIPVREACHCLVVKDRHRLESRCFIRRSRGR